MWVQADQKILDLRGTEQQESAEDCIVRHCVACTLRQILFWRRNEEGWLSWHVVCLEQRRNECTILVVDTGVKILLGSIRHSEKIACGQRYFLERSFEQCFEHDNYPLGCISAKKYFHSKATTSFSRRNLLLGVSWVLRHGDCLLVANNGELFSQFSGFEKDMNTNEMETRPPLFLLSHRVSVLEFGRGWD